MTFDPIFFSGDVIHPRPSIVKGWTKGVAGPVSISFDEVFPVLFARCCAVGYRMLGDRASAEDVAAEAMSRAYARWRTLSTVDYVEPWVLRVTANLALDQLRRRRRQLSTAEGKQRFDDDVAMRITLEAALSQLPTRQRQVIMLRYLADLSEPEIVAVTGLSAGTVKTHLRRSTTSLRRILAEFATERPLDVLA